MSSDLVPSFTAVAPPEIWRFIFRLATIPSACQLEYQSFEVQYPDGYSDDEIARLKVLCSLVRVCKLWRALAEEFLYEDVRILSLPAIEAVRRALKRSAEENGSYLEGVGRFIRRLELPLKRIYLEPRRPFHLPAQSTAPQIPIEEILCYCPNLEILVRHVLRLDGDDIHVWGGLVAKPLENTRVLLPKLRRINWFEGDLDLRMFNIANSRRLSEILSHSPNLEYLYVSSERKDVLSSLSLGASLKTLQIDRVSHTPSSRTRDMPLAPAPSLTNLIIHASVVSAMLPFLTTAGPQIRVIELVFSVQATVSANKMQRIFSRCPNVEEFAYHLGAPEISAFNEGFQHKALQRIRLQVNSDEYYPYKFVVRGQFEILAGPSFPGLRQIILHDPAKSFVRRDSSVLLLQKMAERRFPLEYENGTPVPFQK
ncbi:hypothetical protein C8J56DRAFT_822597 [Mycena floridula]|nr:hypothetical protein C8J56DRAFT_822597 [Mycena floridula]